MNKNALEDYLVSLIDVEWDPSTVEFKPTVKNEERFPVCGLENICIHT